MPLSHPVAASLVRRASPGEAREPPATGGRIGLCQEPPGAASEAAQGSRGGMRTPAELLAGRSGSTWDPRDAVASIRDYRCCSEGMWRNRVEPRGNGAGLLITQRSRV